ncbi:arylesterase [Paracidobacterium acidisoli]|uniref:Arylesterase n=1 Tax=Paracidobacterium acidisoli TaxID=2303751 RepID=A0A372IS35_9BACT|nr:arylesterase [Paracidobacterium acidisoli]MBT9330652.1 arylesterase [Paracidobacterium acidisoli]
MRRRFLLLVALLLPLPIYAAPAAPVPAIVCFGDSITAGYGAEPGHSYPDYIQKALSARGYRYHVVNLGISGNTSKDGVNRLKDVLKLHPAVVIVEFGGNDGLRGLPLSVTRDNIDAIVGTLRKAGSRVLLAGITLPPNYGPDYIHQFDEMYHAVAAKYRVPLLPMLYANVYTVPGTIQEDGIHPTAKGAELIAQNFLPLLLPMLHK